GWEKDCRRIETLIQKVTGRANGDQLVAQFDCADWQLRTFLVRLNQAIEQGHSLLERALQLSQLPRPMESLGSQCRPYRGDIDRSGKRVGHRIPPKYFFLASRTQHEKATRCPETFAEGRSDDRSI